jgi:hypothetical protein
VSSPAGRRFEGSGEVVRRRVSLAVGAVALSIVGLGLMVVGAPSWGVLVEEGLALTLLLAFATNAYPARWRGRLIASESGVSAGGRLLVRRGRIASAFQVSTVEPVVRIVCRAGPPFDLKVENDDDARAVLDALGLGIGRSIATFRVAIGGRAVLVAWVAFIGVMGAVLGGLAGAGAHRSTPLIAPLAMGTLLLALLFVVQARVQANVDVGSDGILLRRLGGARFLPYGTLHGTAVQGESVVLLLRSGERVPMGFGKTQLEERDAMWGRIEEARIASVAGAIASGADSLVAPGGRAPGRWLREVRALASARDYREARLDPEGLWRVVDDATASPGTRAGAALALSTLDGASRTRLHVAAQACAEPRLRVALTRVAEGASDTELEEALTPLLESKS